jgi:hypothetical protein
VNHYSSVNFIFESVAIDSFNHKVGANTGIYQAKEWYLPKHVKIGEASRCFLLYIIIGGGCVVASEACISIQTMMINY